jgi:hypothetical protein
MPYWTVLRSAPGHDVLAYEGVVRAGFEIFTPKIRTRIGAKWRTSPLFGWYFFARVVDQWRALGCVDTYRIHRMMAARVTTAR